MMKKLLSVLLALVLCVSLAACGGGSDPAPAPSNAAPSSAAPEPSSDAAPEAEADGDTGEAGAEAPEDFTEVDSYTEIPVLDYIKDKLIPVPTDLVGSWWNFAGGFVGGRDMTQEEADAVTEAYGGYLACNFESENASITKEPYILYGPYTVQEDGYTVLLELENMEDGAACPFVGVFADIDGTRVMVMISAADPATALYMAEPAGDAG